MPPALTTPQRGPTHELALPEGDPRAAGDRPVCAVTGASGYVGGHVAAHLAGAGWAVRALSRSPAAACAQGFAHFRFDLGTHPAPEALAGCDALVHAAYDFGARRRPDVQRVNVDGSRLLFVAARAAGVQRIVCISTVAAFPGARSRYGRAKLEVERAAAEVGAAIVRPGLVWDPHGGTMFAALRGAVARMPIVPLPVPPGLELTLVHAEDLALLVERLLVSWPAASSHLLVAACEQRLGFAELLRSLAPTSGPVPPADPTAATVRTPRAGRPGRAPRAGPHLVRLPWRAAWLGLLALERLGVSPPFRSDSLISLVGADPDPFARATDTAGRYGVKFRPYPPPDRHRC